MEPELDLKLFERLESELWEGEWFYEIDRCNKEVPFINDLDCDSLVLSWTPCFLHRWVCTPSYNDEYEWTLIQPEDYINVKEIKYRRVQYIFNCIYFWYNRDFRINLFMYRLLKKSFVLSDFWKFSKM